MGSYAGQDQRQQSAVLHRPRRPTADLPPPRLRPSTSVSRSRPGASGKENPPKTPPCAKPARKPASASSASCASLGRPPTTSALIATKSGTCTCSSFKSMSQLSSGVAQPGTPRRPATSHTPRVLLDPAPECSRTPGRPGCADRRDLRGVGRGRGSCGPLGVPRPGLRSAHFARSGTCTKSPRRGIGQRRLVHWSATHAVSTDQMTGCRMRCRVEWSHAARTGRAATRRR